MSFYLKNKECVLINPNNDFLYEVFVFVHFKGQTSLANHKYFVSKKEIKNIVTSYYINKNIEIVCELYSAPKNWLENNDFIWIEN